MANNYYRLENPAGTYDFGLKKFFDPLNPQLPKFPEEFGSTPDLPKPLKGENHHLGKIWDADYYARIHSGILGPLTVQFKTESPTYSWSRVEFHPGRARPAIYGETPEIISRSESFFQGSLQGVVPTGIQIPRGIWEKGIDAFNLLWDVQVNYLYESLEVFAQGQIYYRILNNPDPLKYFIRKKKLPITGMNVEGYLTNYTNPCVNIFRKLRGWRDFYLFDKKMLNMYYPSRLSDGREKSWVFLLSPEADEIARFRKQEDLLYLYSGEVQKKYPYINMKDYTEAANNPKYNFDAVYQIPNFHIHKDMTLGKTILSRIVEYPRYYRFYPHNMIQDIPVKDYSTYDITIVNDIQKSKNKLKYRDAVKAFDLDQIPDVFNLNDGDSFHHLVTKTIRSEKALSELEDDEDYLNDGRVKRVITPITTGNVKNAFQYYRYMLKMMDTEKSIVDLKTAINGGNDNAITNSFEKLLGKINTLVDFIGDYVSTEEPRKKKEIVAIFLIILIPDVFTVNVIIQYDPDIRLVKHTIIDTEDAFTVETHYLYGFTFNELKNNDANQNEVLGRIFSDIILVGNNKKKFSDIAHKLLKLYIDMPFGIFLFKRQVYLTDSTPKVRKKSIDQLSQKLLANVYQEPKTGEITIGVWKSFGERVKETRDIKIYEDTFFKKCTVGGGNIYWKLPPNNNNRNYGFLRSYKYGDIWVVPVTLNEVLGPRSNMINRNGFDDEAEWNEVLSDTNLRKSGNPYYSTFKKICKLYKWNVSRKGLYNEGSFFFNNKLVKNKYNHWAGWQKSGKDGVEDPEKGPFEGNYLWWEEQNPVLNVRQLKERVD